MNILNLINQGTFELKFNNIATSKLDSEILLAKAIGKSREEILINYNKELNHKDICKFNELISRRKLKEPIAYILEEKEFWSKKFLVNKSTLIPRPETELLVEELVKIYKDKSIKILDVGIGSGCILISLLSELKKSSGIGIDISHKALNIAKKNIKKHNLIEKIKLFKKSLSEIYQSKFDLIVSNPPYIETRTMRNLDDDIRRYEPLIALDGGNDGLDVIKKLIYKAKYILKIRGKLALEIGNEQFKKVSNILRNNNFKIEKNIKDYKDNTRCLVSTLIR